MKKLIASALAASMMLAGAASASASGGIASGKAAAVADGLAITDDSHLILDRDAGIVDNIDGKITAKKLKSNFVGDVSVKSPAGDVRADGDYVATDDIVSCGVDVSRGADVSVGAESLRAIIYGDVNRDGEINLLDAVSALRSIAGHSVDISTSAADVNRDGVVDAADVTKLLRKIAGWENLSLGNVRMVAANEKLTAPAEDADIDLFFTSPMRKVGRSETESSGIYAYKMMMAKNETESAQVFLVSAENKEGLTAELSDFEYEYGEFDVSTISGEVLREYYYELTRFYDLHKADYNLGTTDYFSEPLLPDAGEFELTAERSQAFMLNVTTTKDAKSGMYRATFNVKDSDGKVIKTAYVYTYVWNFALSDTPASRSAFGMGQSKMENYEKYYNFLLDYNVTPQLIPYDLRSDEADKYMSDPRVTSFRMGAFAHNMSFFGYTHYFGEGDIGDAGQIAKNDDPEVMAEYLRTEVAKVNSNDLWKEKSYFTIIDEPFGQDMYNRIRNYDQWMQEVLGHDDYKMLLCIAGNSTYDEINYMDALEFVTPYLEIWAPQSRAFTLHTDGSPGVQRFSDTRSYLTYGNFIDRIDTLLDEGDELWWYICVMPQFPYPNYFNYYDGVVNRLVLWQQYMFGVKGILYWDVNAYMGNLTLNNYGAWSGDGQLLYTGGLWGLGNDCPIPSFRLIQIRDSFDDYDYMAIAEELLGREAVLDQIFKVTKSILDFTEDYRDLDAARNELGQMIEDALAET